MTQWQVPSPSTSDNSQGVVMVMLCLNLIVLAFFILLNAHAKPAEERTAAALYSVQNGFDYRTSSDAFGDDAVRLDNRPVWIPRAADVMRGEVLNIMPTLEAERLRTLSHEVRLELAPEDVWSEGVLRENVRALLMNLRAGLTREWGGDIAMVVDVWLSSAREGDVMTSALREVVLASSDESDLSSDVSVVSLLKNDELPGTVWIRLQAKTLVGLPDFALRVKSLAGAVAVPTLPSPSAEAADGR